MVFGCYRIKIKKYKEAKRFFKKWYGDYRYAYNNAVWYINNSTCFYSKFDLRNLIVGSEVNSIIPWHLKTPKDIREQGVFEAHKNFQACLTNLKEKNIKKFKLNFLRKKKPRHSFGIGSHGVTIVGHNSVSLFPRITKKLTIKLSQTIPKNCYQGKKFNHEVSIYFDGINYYLIIPYEKEIVDTQKPKRLVAIDPGNRTFLTTYDNLGESYSFGSEMDYQKLKNMILQLSELQSQGKRKERIKLENKIQNIRRHQFYNYSNFLCQNYRNILLPKLDTNSLLQLSTNSKMNKRLTAKIGHGYFRELMEFKSKVYNIHLQINNVNEMYSSRLCSKCLFINDPCSLKIKTCKKCKMSMDRDLNAARNKSQRDLNKHLIEC